MLRAHEERLSGREQHRAGEAGSLSLQSQQHGVGMQQGFPAMCAMHTAHPQQAPLGQGCSSQCWNSRAGAVEPWAKAGTTITTRLSVYFGAQILPLLSGLCSFAFWGMKHFKKPLWWLVSECPSQSRHIFLTRQVKSEFSLPLLVKEFLSLLNFL